MANSCTLSRGTEEEIQVSQLLLVPLIMVKKMMMMIIDQVRGFTPSLVRQLLTALATLLTAGLPLLLFRWLARHQIEPLLTPPSPPQMETRLEADPHLQARIVGTGGQGGCPSCGVGGRDC